MPKRRQSVLEHMLFFFFFVVTRSRRLVSSPPLLAYGVGCLIPLSGWFAPVWFALCRDHWNLGRRLLGAGP